MPKLITLCLMPEQEEQLKQIRDTHKDAYMRERAAAIIKVSQGMSPRQVALTGLPGYLARPHNRLITSLAFNLF